MPRDLFFANGQVVYAMLLLIPLFALLFYGWLKRKEALKEIIGQHAMLLKGSTKQVTRAVLLFLGVFFTLLALLRPEGNLKSRASGRLTAPLELYLVIDSSLSMGVKDALNGTSRFERSKEIAAKLIEVLEGDQMAFSLFSDRLQTIVPLTYDALFLRLALRGVSLNEGGFSGTNFEPVLKQLSNQLEKSSYRGNPFVLFLTDGGDTTLEDMTGAEKKSAIAEIVKNAPSIPIGAVLVGSLKGGPIPEVTINGKAVDSKADPDLLQALAPKHFFMDSEEVVDEVLQAMQSEKKQYLQGQSKDWSASSYFQIPLGLALLCFFLANPLPKLRFWMLLIMTTSAFSEELWLQDRKLYNESVKALEEKNYSEALIVLEGISPLAYSSPLFRSRIAINYGEACLGKGIETKDPQLLEQGLFIVRLFKLLPCEPLSLCYPELVGLVEGKLQMALSSLEVKERRSFDHYPYIHFAAMMPSPEIIQRVGLLIPAVNGISKSFDVLRIAFLQLQKEEKLDEEGTLATELRKAVTVSFMQLQGDASEELKSLQGEFPKMLLRIDELQKAGFNRAVCQCSPWSEVIPLLVSGGGYMDAAVAQKPTGELFRYENEAVKKFRSALLKWKSVKTTENQKQKASRELSEMEQMDVKKAPPPRLDKSAEGKPW